jgi:acyl transferase domain-containing protein
MQPLVTAASFLGSRATAAMGVYVGIQQMEYGSLAAPHLGAMGAFTATGTPFSVAAGRLSFHYGLKGRRSICCATCCSDAALSELTTGQTVRLIRLRHMQQLLSTGICCSGVFV